MILYAKSDIGPQHTCKPLRVTDGANINTNFLMLPQLEDQVRQQVHACPSREAAGRQVAVAGAKGPAERLGDSPMRP
jgi:hypothetical protein